MKSLVSALCVVVCMSLFGCGQQAASCATENGIMTAVRSARVLADETVPEEVAGRDRAFGIADDFLALGVAAIEACTLGRGSDTSWAEWLTLGFRALRALKSLIEQFGVDLPFDLAGDTPELEAVTL